MSIRLLRFNSTGSYARRVDRSLIGCRSDSVLDITGLTTYGPHRRRTSTEMAGCPYTTALGLQLEAMCDGRRTCYISNQLLQLTKQQCPGVSTVFVEVDCKPPGITSVTSSSSVGAVLTSLTFLHGQATFSIYVTWHHSI